MLIAQNAVTVDIDPAGGFVRHEQDALGTTDRCILAEMVAGRHDAIRPTQGPIVQGKGWTDCRIDTPSRACGVR